MEDNLEIRIYLKDWKDNKLLVITSGLPPIPFNKVTRVSGGRYFPSVEFSSGMGFSREPEKLLKSISSSFNKSRGYVFGYSAIVPKNVCVDILVNKLNHWLDHIPSSTLDHLEGAVSVLGPIFRDFQPDFMLRSLYCCAFYHLYLPSLGESDLILTRKIDILMKDFITAEKGLAKRNLSSPGSGRYFLNVNVEIYYDYILEL